MTRGVALVTGAARRIGRAIALGLAADGWAVAIHHHRSRDDALRLADEIAALGGRAAPVAADLRDEGETRALVAVAQEALGPVTLLVNNASLFEPDGLATASADSWQRHHAINLRAPFLLTQAFARDLPAAMTGSIVNITDHRVWKPNPACFSYMLSKAGLWTLTRIAAQALAPRIRVNAVGPGPVLPNAHQPVELFEKEAAALPLGKGPRLEEIVDAVRYLLAAPSVTGQMIAVDGGQHLAWETPDLLAGRGE
ncbi:MAG: SDR family oxidoreductase [Rhodothalassiaceae bacterium]